MMFAQAVQRAAQVNGDGTATVFLDRHRSWRAFRDRVARLAAGLQSLDVGPGDHVAILGLNSDRYIEVLYAIWWVGAVVVPMNIRWSVAETLWSLEDAGVGVLISDDAFAEMANDIRSKARPLTRFIHMGEAPEGHGFLNVERLIVENAPIAPIRRDPMAMAGLYYTGGTTGRPKGVMISELALWSSAISIALDLQLDQQTRYLHAAPMFHLADGAMTIALTIVAGSHIVLPAFRPDHVAQIIESQRVSTTLLVPTMIRMLVDDPLFLASDLSSLKTISYGASPMPEKTLHDAMQALPGVGFIQAYGQTELAPLCAILHEEFHRGPSSCSKRSAAGRAGFCVEVKIADEHGHELPSGEVGEIWVRGPNVMMGYWNAPDLTAQFLVDGWVRTGDAGHMDADGFIYISDRVKDMIISGGENVFSVEVENALLSHDDVREAAVIGVPDETYGERVHAIVVPSSGRVVDIAALQAHCRSIIAGYKCPRSFEIRDSSLPLSAAGKVLKADLRAPYWAGKNKAVN